MAARDREAGRRHGDGRGRRRRQAADGAYTVDHATGLVTFVAGHIPAAGAAVTAGFLFDVPVRFDTDKLEVSLTGFRTARSPTFPIVEIRL